MTTTTLPTIDSPSTRERDITTTVLFLLVTLGAAIGLPTYAYFYDYSWLDWTMFFVLYIFTAIFVHWNKSSRKAWLKNKKTR